METLAEAVNTCRVFRTSVHPDAFRLIALFASSRPSCSQSKGGVALERVKKDVVRAAVFRVYGRDNPLRDLACILLSCGMIERKAALQNNLR